MAFMDKLGNIAKNLGDKASDAAETVKINSRISSERKAMEDLRQKLGALRYAAYQNGAALDEQETELCRSIDERGAAIVALQAELEELRQTGPAPSNHTAPAQEATLCSNCGATIAHGNVFCAGCGARL